MTRELLPETTDAAAALQATLQRPEEVDANTGSKANNSQPFISKRLHLPKHIDKHTVLNEPVVSQQTLSDLIRADELLALTEAECASRIKKTQEDVADATQRATEDVLRESHQLLSHWRKSSEQQMDILLPLLARLVTDSLQQLLFALPEHDVMTTLINQIHMAKGTVAKARLYCHSEKLEMVNAILATQSNSLWELQADNTLSESEVRLEDSQGDYQASLALSVDAIRNALT